VWPLAAGTVASAKTEHTTGWASACSMTGTNTPALLCATSTSGWPGSVPGSPAATAAATLGQNGGPPSATASSDGTTAGQPRATSSPATGDQVDGPTDGLCTSTNSGTSRHCQLRPPAGTRSASGEKVAARAAAPLA
jgi:hypothetical protein